MVFGFEHLEHRYRKLTQKELPSILVAVRINLNDLLKEKYGFDYASDPRMPTLMELNGGRVQGFLTGKEESEAFAAKDFIRMNTSTIDKVGFFAHVIEQSIQGKLRTAGKSIAIRIDRLLESRQARVIAALSGAIGLLLAIIQIAIWTV